MGKDTGMGGLVLKGLGFGLAKRFRWFGGIFVLLETVVYGG